MKKLLLAFSLTAPIFAGAQTYSHPTVGMAGEYIGACMAATCSGTYTDDGGGGSGNYSNAVNGIYRTFCPNAPGQCVRVCFTSISFHLSNCIPGNVPCDVLYVLDGPTQNSPLIAVLDYTYNGATPCFTATNPSGCLSFRFFSSSANNAPGWSATISCVSCSANTLADNNDCISATVVCSNASFSGASVGPGTASEGCAGCNTSEHFTNWYRFCAQTSGTLQFAIDPQVNTQDYDFALYGANVTCTSLGTPVRCSYAAGSGNTGLRAASVDASENVAGDGWVSPLNVIAGQCFYLMISQWSAGGAGFTIDFTGSTTSLNCILLPIELLDFTAVASANTIQTSWVTGSETGNDFFTVERSTDASDFTPIGIVRGAGNSTTTRQYFFEDRAPVPGTLYYRLKQTDFNGAFTYSSTVAVRFSASHGVLYLVPNPVLNKTDLIYNSPANMKTSVKVFDIKGLAVFSVDVLAQQGINHFPIDLQKLNRGIFVVVLKNDLETMECRLEKQ
jgi:hypothetical protein